MKLLELDGEGRGYWRLLQDLPSKGEVVAVMNGEGMIECPDECVDAVLNNMTPQILRGVAAFRFDPLDGGWTGSAALPVMPDETKSGTGIVDALEWASSIHSRGGSVTIHGHYVTIASHTRKYHKDGLRAFGSGVVWVSRGME